jgi:L-iditol 2-dehydrogenase
LWLPGHEVDQASATYKFREIFVLAIMESASISAAFVKDGGGVELRSVPKPTAIGSSIMVEMMASGICGTDLEKLTGRYTASTVLGHEVSGRVSESRSSEFLVGDRVIPHHHVACNECELCRVGAFTMCDGFRNSNFVPGGFSQYFLVPEYNVVHGGVHKIGKDLSYGEASFAEPLACCLRGLHNATSGYLKHDAMRNVLVVGAGPIGLLHMELVRAQYPDVFLCAVDLIEHRLQFAEKNEGAHPIDLGGITNGQFSKEALNLRRNGFDLVIMATGNPAAFGESLKSARKSGVVLLFGAPHKGSIYNLDLYEFFLRETKIVSSYATTESEIAEAIQILEKRRIDVAKFITGRYRLQQIEAAMDAARSSDNIKIIVTN